MLGSLVQVEFSWALWGVGAPAAAQSPASAPESPAAGPCAPADAPPSAPDASLAPPPGRGSTRAPPCRRGGRGRASQLLVVLRYTTRVCFYTLHDFNLCNYDYDDYD